MAPLSDCSKAYLSVSTLTAASTPGVELRLFGVLHDGIGLILTCYGLVFYIATYYIHSLWT
ncbi:hypothetical protein DAEQUDRAFT_734200 [Daedalea quercina L-15889]|uniref:Uncharacterized protein n=1 Tax=Daedalea quercina L-15889 TaxID=1314783 RepID=A0A165KGU2_9APHY|nr:hypothetical protein DAEQUDRAFT_734200 [Daedalea quercina L-15889]